MKLFAPLLFLLLALPANAQPAIDRVAIGVAGGTISSGSVQMDLSLGQPVAGSTLGGSAHGDLGFWWQVATITTGASQPAMPTKFALRQSAPNPFSTATSITYAIPRGPVPVFIGIFNLQGGLIRTLVHEPKPAGTFTVSWDGRDDNGRSVPVGVYFTQFHAGTYQRTGKTVMLK